jgi:hypothetical protein
VNNKAQFMRPLFLLAVLSLFLLVPALITRAQKLTVSGNVYDKGTVKNTFTTPHGTIITILPDDIRPGDQITGTVIYEPEGRREKDFLKNKTELLKYSLSAEPRPAKNSPKTTAAESLKDVFILQPEARAEAMKDVFVLQNKPQATMHGGAEHARDIFITELSIPAAYAGENLHIILRDPLKKLVAESSSPILDNSIPAAGPFNYEGRNFVPDKTIYMAGEQAVIGYQSSSSAPKSGTMVYLNRNRQKELSAELLELKPLVISPRQIVVSIPENIYGDVELVFKTVKADFIASERIHVLQLEASCPKTNLRKGESTVLDVKVNGLKSCPAEYVRLSLDNRSTNAVKMGNSNREDLIIKTASSENVFTVQRPVTALQTGGFNIDIALNYPSSAYNFPVRHQSEALKANTDLVNSLIQDINFPEINANNTAHVPVMSVYYPRKGSLGNSPPAQRTWTVNNFRLEIDGLPCQGITKVDALKLETKTSKADIGFIVPVNESKAWLQWLEIKAPRNGTIQYSKDINGSYFTIEFKDARPLSVVTSPGGDLYFKIVTEKAIMNFSEGILSDLISDLDP